MWLIRYVLLLNQKMWSRYQTNRVKEQVTNPVEGDSFLGGSSEPERGYNPQREIGKRNATKGQ